MGMDSSEAEVREVEEDRDREEVEQVVEPWEVRKLLGQGWNYVEMSLMPRPKTELSSLTFGRTQKA